LQCDRVGQSNFTDTDSFHCNSSSVQFPTIVVIDDFGVYLADTNHCRVLFFPGTSTIPNRVYGQEGFDSCTCRGGLIHQTNGVAVNNQWVYISDSDQSCVWVFTNLGNSTTPSSWIVIATVSSVLCLLLIGAIVGYVLRHRFIRQRQVNASIWHAATSVKEKRASTGAISREMDSPICFEDTKSSPPTALVNVQQISHTTAMENVQHSSPVAITRDLESPPDVDDESLCVICLTNLKTHVLIPCGHLCVCSEHASNLIACPLCRAQVASSHKVFQ